MAPDLFALALVRSYVEGNPRFIERPWLAGRIEKALEDPDCRFLLLTGEPGSGKTAVMAWLAHRHGGWLRYFIRRDSEALFSFDGSDARSLLFALGHQLAALRPGLFYPEKLEVIVQQRLGEIAPGGKAIGIKVADLHVSPFYETALRVDQQVSVVGGELTGITVGRLVADPRLLELDTLQHLALIDPARLLHEEDSKARLVILIDALDELRYRSGGTSVLDWLVACPELPANVRFVLTSRPDDRLLDVFRRTQQPWLRDEWIDAESENVRQDLTESVIRFAREPKIAAALVRHDTSTDRFVSTTVARAEGNFQYLVALFRALDALLASPETGSNGETEEQFRRLLRLEGVPPRLGDLYSFFLARIRSAVADERIEVPGASFGIVERLPAWEGLYQRILGVLAVARRPLTRDQLRLYGAIDSGERWVDSALARLRQFLDQDAGGGYRLYHATFAEYLTDTTTRRLHPEQHLDPGEWHRTIAGRALSRWGADWLQCDDDYALAETPGHLVASIAGEAGLLRQQAATAAAGVLTSVSFLERKAERLGIDALLADFTAFRSAVPEPDADVSRVGRALDREAHTLRTWDPSLAPAHFTQQVRNRAVDLGVTELAAAAEARLTRIGKPYVALSWRTGGESSALVRLLTGHTREVMHIAMTADGEWAVSAAADLTCRVWNLDSGREHRAWRVEDQITALAIANDARHVVQGFVDGAVRVVELESGAALHACRPDDRGMVKAIALTPDGRRAVVAWSGSLHLWDLDADVWQMIAGEPRLLAVAITADGSHVISASRDRRVQTWDLSTHAAVSSVQGPLTLAAIASRKRGTSISEEQLAEAMAATARARWPESIRYLPGLASGPVDVNALNRQLEKGTVTAAAVAVNGHSAVWGLFDGLLNIWDLENGADLYTAASHGREVLAVAMSHDGARAISAGHDRLVRVWNVDTGEQTGVLSGHAASVWAVTMSRDGRRAVSGSAAGELIIWDVEACQVTFPGHTNVVTSVDTTLDGRRVVSGSHDRSIRLWDGETGREIGGPPPEDQPVLAVRLSSDGRYIGWGFLYNESVPMLRMWDVEGGGAPRTFSGHTDLVYVDIFSSSTPRVWNADRMGELKYLTGYQYQVWAISLLNHRRLLVAAWDAHLKVFDLETGEAVATLQGHDYPVSALVISSDGSYALSGAVDGTIRVWDMRQLRALHALEPHDFQIARLAITDDGRRAASSSVDGTLMMWHVDSATRISRIQQRGRALAGLAMRADGGHDVVSWAGDALTTWDLETGAERRVMRGHGGEIVIGRVLSKNHGAISSGRDRRLIWWDLETGRPRAIVAVDGLTSGMAVANGLTVFTGDSSGRLCRLTLVDPIPTAGPAD